MDGPSAWFDGPDSGPVLTVILRRVGKRRRKPPNASAVAFPSMRSSTTAPAALFDLPRNHGIGLTGRVSSRTRKPGIRRNECTARQTTVPIPTCFPTHGAFSLLEICGPPALHEAGEATRHPAGRASGQTRTKREMDDASRLAREYGGRLRIGQVSLPRTLSTGPGLPRHGPRRSWVRFPKKPAGRPAPRNRKNGTAALHQNF